MKWAVATVCAYEVVAVTTGRPPTVTRLCARHRRWLPLIVLGALAVHLYRPVRCTGCEGRCPPCAGC